MTNQTDFSLELLDMTMDEIEDLPGFEVPYNGDYLLKLTSQTKVVNDKPALECTFEVIECLKKDNDADPDSKEGDKFSKLFFLKNDDPEKLKIQLGFLKQFVAGVAEQVGEGNLAVLFRDHLASAVVQATVKRKVDKEDKEKVFAEVKNMRLA